LESVKLMKPGDSLRAMLLISILVTSTIAAWVTPPDAEAEAVAQTIGQLRSHNPNGMEVSPEVQSLIAELKQRMRSLFINELNRSFTATALDPAIVNVNIVNRLKSVNVVVGPIPAPDPNNSSTDPPYVRPAFGHIEETLLSRSPNNPGVVLLTIKLGLPCGGDISITGLSKGTSDWRSRFVREGNNYASLADAFGEITVDVSRPNQDGSFLAVSAASGTCPSESPITLSLSAIKVGVQPSGVSELFKVNDPQRVQNAVSSGASVLAEPDSFEISFNVTKFLERGHPTRRRTIRFLVVDETLTPTAPLIPDEVRVADFVDEWFALPLNKARPWVGGVAKSIIDCRHDVISGRVGTAATPQILGSTPSCLAGSQIITIGFVGLSETFYVSVGKKNGAGSILGINTVRPTCSP
jgi:hypothetical protein